MAKDVLRVAVASNPKMTRRRYLALAGGAVVVAAAAAGGYYLLSNQTGPTKTTRKLSESVRWDAPGGSLGDALALIVPEFTKEYGVKVELAAISNDVGVMLAKAKSGGLDLVETGDDTLYLGTTEGVWQPLNLENIPNQKKLPELFRTNGYGAFDPGYKDGIFHGVCGPVYGTIGLGYNYGKIPGEVNSWAPLFDQQYAGKIIVQDDYIQRMEETAVYLGQKFNNFSDVNAIWDALRKQQKLVLKYWTSGAEQEQLFSTEEAWIGDCYAGRIMKTAAKNVPVKYVLPREGVRAWGDVFCVGLNSPHQYEAELLLNWLLEPKNTVAISKAYGYPPVTDVSLISQADIEELKKMPDFAGSDLSKLAFIDGAYFDTHKQEWMTKWEEVKAGL